MWTDEEDEDAAPLVTRTVGVAAGVTAGPTAERVVTVGELARRVATAL